MTDTPYINLHTHFPTGAAGVQEMESLYFGQEAGAVAAWFSAGLHPWYLDGVDLEVAERWLRQQAGNPGMLAVGEAGLDKVTRTPWALQLDAFQRCIRVAAAYRKPLIVHCVRAHEAVLETIRPQRTALPGVVFHGFDKHPQTAQQLLNAGCFLSFGTALLRPGSHAAEALQQAPPDRIFLETDDKALDIRTVYTRAAAIRHLPEEEMKALVWHNFRSLFLPPD